MIKVPVIFTTNNKGLKAAEKGVGAIGKAFKKTGLASKLSVAAAVAGITLLSKRSLAAALSEEKANKSLQQTLNNIGKSRATPGILAFTDSLQRASGVSEDILKPNLQKLITTTEDVAASQELLKRAMDISAGSGKSLDTVVAALNRAYSGNFKALGKLNVGLDQTLLASGDLDAIMGQLQQKFGGQTQAAAETLAGKLDKLKVVAGEAAENFGNKLITAFEQFSTKGTGALDDIGRNIETFSTRAGNAVIGLGAVFNDLKIGLMTLNEQTGGFLGKTVGALLTPLKYLEERGKATAKALELQKNLGGARKETETLAMNRQKIASEKKYQEALKKTDPLAKANAKAEKAAAEAAKKKAQKEREANAAKKLALMFDMDNIQIEAALKGKLTDEEKARLLALKAIKTDGQNDDLKALEDLDAARKKALAQFEADKKAEVLASQKSIDEQKAQQEAFNAWMKNNPLKIYTQFTNMAGQQVTAPQGFGIPGTNAAANAPATNAAPSLSNIVGTPRSSADVVASGDVYNISVSGVIGNEQQIQDYLYRAIQQGQRNGYTIAPAGFI